MSKAWLRATALACLVLASVGCELLWAPLETRDNPLDSWAEPVVLSLTPTLDGTVMDPGINTAELKVSSAQYAVMRFDLSGAPATISSVTLTLQCSAITAPFQFVEAYPFLVDWNESTIQSSELAPGAGLLPSAPADEQYVEYTVAYSFDLTSVASSLSRGLALRGTGSTSVSFHSSVTAGMEPRLVITGRN